MNKNSVSIFPALIGAAVLCAGVSTSAAAATSSYPGSMCIGDRSTDNANIRHGYNGDIFNANANASTVNCPLVRSSYPYSSLVMYVKDKSTLGDISCTVMTRSVLGSLGSWNTVSSTGVDPTSYGQTLDFGSETYSYAGYSYLRCYLPTTGSGEYVYLTSYTISAP